MRAAQSRSRAAAGTAGRPGSAVLGVNAGQDPRLFAGRVSGLDPWPDRGAWLSWAWRWSTRAATWHGSRPWSGGAWAKLPNNGWSMPAFLRTSRSMRAQARPSCMRRCPRASPRVKTGPRDWPVRMRHLARLARRPHRRAEGRPVPGRPLELPGDGAADMPDNVENFVCILRVPHL